MRTYTLYVGTHRGEAEDRESILEIAIKRFESFTLIPAIGVFRGKRETTTLIRIASPDLDSVVELAVELRKELDQDGVGIEAFGHYFRATKNVTASELVSKIQSIVRKEAP